MSPQEIRAAVARAIVRDRTALVATALLYPAMVAWSAFAVGRVSGPAMMLPATLVAGAWVWITVRRRIRGARAALTSDAELARYWTGRLDRTIAVKSRYRWFAPTFAILTLAMCLLVVRHANAIYWVGGFTACVTLVASGLHAHLSLRADRAARASVGPS